MYFSKFMFSRTSEMKSFSRYFEVFKALTSSGSAKGIRMVVNGGWDTKLSRRPASLLLELRGAADQVLDRGRPPPRQVISIFGSDCGFLADLLGTGGLDTSKVISVKRQRLRKAGVSYAAWQAGP